MAARKLKNGPGDGANIHVFNIKRCVFPAKFRTPSCQSARRACRLGIKTFAYRVFLFHAPTPRDDTINRMPYTRAVLGHVAPGLPRVGWSQQEFNHALSNTTITLHTTSILGNANKHLVELMSQSNTTFDFPLCSSFKQIL